MTTTALAPLRQISISTSDGATYQLDEFHGFSTLKRVSADGTTEHFDNVEIDYQDLEPGHPLSWCELVFDGSVVWHDGSRVVASSEII